MKRGTGDQTAVARATREPLEYDANFAGPTKNRSCTDVFWLLLFIVFLGGWTYVGYHGFTRGDPKRLLAPTDSQGNKCGLDAGFQDKPFLVFFDIIRCANPGVAITGCLTPQVCVEHCPNTSILFSEVTNPDRTTFDSLICNYTVNKGAITTYQQMMQYINDGACASYVLDSQSVLARCIGTDLSILSCKETATIAASGFTRSSLAAASSQRNSDQVCVRNPQKVRSLVQSRANALDSYVGFIAAGWVTYFTSNTPEIENLSVMIVEDLVSSRILMLAAAGLVVVVCYIYVLLLRWVVAPVVWFSLIGLIALLSYGIYRCYDNYVNVNEYRQSLTNAAAILESIFHKKETWMTLLVICALLAVILLLVVIFLRNRISIAIALIEEGSKAVGSNKTTIFYPLLPWLMQCGVVAFSIVCLVFLLSVGESRFVISGLQQDSECVCTPSYTDGDMCTPQEFMSRCFRANTNQPCSNATCHYSYIARPTYIDYFIVVNVLGFFWLLAFIQGMSDLTLAGTFSRWYWTFNKRKVPFFSLSRGIYTSIRYHMGTVALGSLILAIVQVIRVFLEYIDRKLKKFDNAFVKCILCFCKCCFFCLENFLKFINKNAYIMCAVHGGSFFKSAKDAFNLLMRNLVRVFVLDKVTDFIFFISKLLIAAATGLAVYYIMDWSYLYDRLGIERLHYNVVPAVVLAVVAYFISMLFFNVYSIAVDTLFLCFLEDCERNDGSPERPYFMSKNLMKILGKKNKIH